MLSATRLAEAPRTEPLMVVPFVVNASFACELFLKAIAHRGGVRLSGHKLATLLQDLPEPERQRLDQAWVDLSRDAASECEANLDTVIGELSNSFVEWRYTHEKERVSAPQTHAILLLLKVLDQASEFRSES